MVNHISRCWPFPWLSRAQPYRIEGPNFSKTSLWAGSESSRSVWRAKD